MTELIESKRSGLRALCERYHVRHLALFGSALRDDFDPDHSDLDFCVEFQAMTPYEHAESYFGLLEDLETLFARRVDLLETGAARNPYLRREIEEQQKILFTSSKGDLPVGRGV